MSTYARINLCFDKGKGSWLYTKNGKKYLDFASGIAVNTLGHSNPKLIKALNNQAVKLWHTSNLYHIEEQELLAEKLCNLSFAEKVFFCNSGTEATEGVIKMIRHYHFHKGNQLKKDIIVLNDSFHGRTLTGLSAGSNEKHKEGFMAGNDGDYGFIRVSSGDLEMLKNNININTAAIFLEPIQGEGGINVLSKNYLKDVKRICKENDLLLALDEVQCGIARTGKMFAYQWSGIKPDIMGLAKGLGGGFPIGAILTTKAVSLGMTPGTHGSTFGGNQLASVVSNVVLSEVSKTSFLKN